MACPNCGAPGGGASGCGSCGLGIRSNVGTGISANQDNLYRKEQEQKRSSGGGGGGSGGCFAGDTRIFTPSGAKPISAIDKGEVVLSIDSRNNLIPVNVRKVKFFGEQIVYRLKMEDSETLISVTGSHPVQTLRGWLRVKDISFGDELISVQSSGKISYSKFVDVTTSNERIGVYNLYVDGTHTFIADGIVAHSFVHFRHLRHLAHSCLESLMIHKPSREVAA
jgi:hypothetical protein